MARPTELFPGDCYFMVGYHDRDLLIPSITTLVFLREDLKDERRNWLFEFFDANEEDDVGGSELALTDDQLWQVLDLPGLQHKLGAMANFHRSKQAPRTVPSAALNSPDLSGLHEEVHKLLSDPECSSVTITIKYTDDGFSVGRRQGGGVQASFFPHPWLDPTEEAKLLSFFERKGVRPHVDYLADKGRTRVLDFALPDSGDAIVRICLELLTEIYPMQPGDILAFSPHKA